MAPKSKHAKKQTSPEVEKKQSEKSNLDDIDALVSFSKETTNSTISPEMEKWYRVANLTITSLAFLVRFAFVWFPSEIVFDEVHFGKFASYYLERTYFFDLHPPFAKLLIALVGYMVGYDGRFKFDNIGDSYIDNSIPYIPLRCLSVITGTLTVPLMFSTLQECGYSIPTCFFGAAIVAFDNAHVIDSRLILLDATLIISVAASIYCYVRFVKQRHTPFTFNWYKWLFLTGVSLSCVISTKYVGVFTFMCVALLC
ncbi:unnamed protein product [Ambrosiozyma monospora]|uniref:Unnamed protein product n=1 Tax=Ambrosiozyma monospora TaxID=43982 RepID=A0A9W7DM53_AMBMO|nr:unnamed protein product [Ambrosiozyma monospora]